VNSFAISDLIETRVSWGEIAPSEHIAQFYQDDSVLLDTLTGFVYAGLNFGESAIVVATSEHLRALCRRLPATGLDMQRVFSEDRLITLEAETALSSFMVNDWPDEQLFRLFVDNLIRRASSHGRRVRVFGEMVALLWERGLYGATVQLEKMWSQLCRAHCFRLLCSYPRAGCVKDPTRSLSDICAAHTRIVM
jgi:hypothetical protein